MLRRVLFDIRSWVLGLLGRRPHEAEGKSPAWDNRLPKGYSSYMNEFGPEHDR